MNHNRDILTEKIEIIDCFITAIHRFDGSFNFICCPPVFLVEPIAHDESFAFKVAINQRFLKLQTATIFCIMFTSNTKGHTFK